MIALPVMPLISSLLLWPAGVTDPMQTSLRGLLTAATLLALVRHWPARLIVPVYAAGIAAIARLESGPLPAWLQLTAAGVALAAIAWHGWCDYVERRRAQS